MPMLALLALALSIVGVVLGVGIALGFRRSAALSDAPRALGEPLGLAPAVGTAHPTWYVGEIGGRPVAVTFVQMKSRLNALYSDDWLRVAVPVRAPAPLGALAWRQHHAGRAAGTDSFEDAFDRRDAERFPAATRDALLAFARDHGSVRLRDRAGAPAALVPERFHPDAPLLLVHDRKGLVHAPADVRDVVRAMDDVARTLEAGG